MPVKKFAYFQPYATSGQTTRVTSLGLGDRIEHLVKPIAVLLKMPCVKEDKTLKPESPCAKRRNALNDLGNKFGIGNPS